MTKIHSGMARRAFALLILIVLVAGAALPSFGQRRRRPRLSRVTRPTQTRQVQPTYYTVPANTTLRVRMNQEISSRNAVVGDTFTTTVVDPVYSGGIEVIPAGSTVTGRVTSVKKASRKSKAGVLGVHFISVQLPNGTSRTINADLTDLSGDNRNFDEEGQVSGKSATKRNVVFIGGGAATGALIGAIAGGGSGAGIGAAVGGGLGVAGALLSKGHEATVKRDTEFGVVLNQSISLPAANVR